MLVTRDAATCGMGGAVKVTYMCSGCRCALDFKSSSGGIHNGRMYVCDIRQGPPARSGYPASQCPHIHEDYRNSTSHCEADGG